MEKGKMTCTRDFFMDSGEIAFKAGVEYEYEKVKHGSYWFKSEVSDENVSDGFNHSMTDEDLQEAFGTQGEISKSMNINTRPAHKFEINGYWVMVDSKMPTSEFNHIKNELIDYYDMMKILNKQK
jgi:hypothetical protein